MNEKNKRRPEPTKASKVLQACIVGIDVILLVAAFVAWRAGLPWWESVWNIAASIYIAAVLLNLAWRIVPRKMKKATEKEEDK